MTATRLSPTVVRAIKRAFRGDPRWTEYTYPKTGYTDLEITYTEPPYLDDELFPRFLAKFRMWTATKLYFQTNKDDLRRYVKSGTSKYQFHAADLLGIAQIKPKLDIQEAIADYTVVLNDVGHFSIKYVSFLLYNGPRRPTHFLEDD